MSKLDELKQKFSFNKPAETDTIARLQALQATCLRLESALNKLESRGRRTESRLLVLLEHHGIRDLAHTKPIRQQGKS